MLPLLPLVAILALLHPYLWPPGRAPTSPFSDIHHQHAPATELIARALSEDGALPRWNHEDFAGVPTVGDPQAGIYNPVYWLLALTPGPRAFGILIVGYALAGALGFQLWARALGLSAGAGAAGAVVLVLGGSLLLRLVMPGHTVFAPFFLAPLLLWTLARLADQPRPARLAGAALLVGALAVALAPQVLVYAAVVLAPIALPTAARSARPGRTLGAFALAGALGAALAAVHLLPIFALAPEFSRGQPAFAPTTPGLEDFHPGGAWLASVVAGDGPRPEAAFDWEAHLYVGGVALFLALVGVAAWPRGDPRRGLAWLHGALAAAVFLFGIGPTAGLAAFRIPTRAFVLLGLPLGVLTALGVEALGAAPPRRRAVVTGTAWAVALALTLTGSSSTALALVLLAGGAALAAGAAARAPDDRPTGQASVRVVRASREAPGGAGDAPPTFGVLASVGALVTALALDAGRIVAPAVQTAPAGAIGTPAAGLRLPAPGATLGRIAELERGAVEPGIPELAVRRRGLETLAGFNPLIPWRFVVYASYATGLDPLAYRFDVAVPLLEVAEPQLFDLLGVTHVLHPPGTDGAGWRWEERPHAFPRAYLVPGPQLVPEGEGTDAVAPEVAALATLAAMDARRAVLLHGDVGAGALARVGATPETDFEAFRPLAVTRRGANAIALDVTAARPAILVLAEPYLRGWRAWDGAEEIPVVRANVLFRALVLGPGRHRLRLEFRPRAWVIGWWISTLGAAGVLTLLVVAAASWRRAGPDAGGGPGKRHAFDTGGTGAGGLAPASRRRAGVDGEAPAGVTSMTLRHQPQVPALR